MKSRIFRTAVTTYLCCCAMIWALRWTNRFDRQFYHYVPFTYATVLFGVLTVLSVLLWKQSRLLSVAGLVLSLLWIALEAIPVLST